MYVDKKQCQDCLSNEKTSDLLKTWDWLVAYSHLCYMESALAFLGVGKKKFSILVQIPLLIYQFNFAYVSIFTCFAYSALST